MKELSFVEVCMRLSKEKSFPAYVRDYDHKEWEETVIRGIEFSYGEPVYITTDMGRKTYVGVKDEKHHN